MHCCKSGHPLLIGQGGSLDIGKRGGESHPPGVSEQHSGPAHHHWKLSLVEGVGLGEMGPRHCLGGRKPCLIPKTTTYLWGCERKRRQGRGGTGRGRVPGVPSLGVEMCGTSLCVTLSLCGKGKGRLSFWCAALGGAFRTT